MSRIVERFIRENIIECSDEEIRELCPSRISVWYGFDCYRRDV